MINDTLHIIDKNRLELFKEKYSNTHYVFACHVAIPRVFTTDLLYKLWMNFQKDEEGQHLDIPLTYIAELINSPICKEIGYDLYEFYPEIRVILQKDLAQSDRFGLNRKKDLAQFILAYTQFNSHKIPSIVVKEALKFEAEAIIDPISAIQQLMDVVQKELKKDQVNSSGIQRVLKTIEYQSKSLPDGMANNPWQSAQALVGALQNTKAGNIAAATNIIENFKDQISEVKQNSSDSISIPLPEEILESLHLLRQNQEDNKELREMYVLMVGINEYHPDSEIPTMRASLNNCTKFETYVRNLYQDAPEKLHFNKLIGEAATRENVIHTFSEQFKTAQKDAVGIFFFSAWSDWHLVPEELEMAYPSGKMRGYSCYDSRTRKITDLYEIEISHLIFEATRSNKMPVYCIMDN